MPLKKPPASGLQAPAQVAIAWVLAVSGMTAVIIGARTRVHLEMNLGAGGWDFPSELWNKLDQVSALPLDIPRTSKQDQVGLMNIDEFGDLGI